MPNVIENEKTKLETVLAELLTGDPTRWVLPSVFQSLYVVDNTKTRKNVKGLATYEISGQNPGFYTGTSGLKTATVKELRVEGSYSEFKIRTLLNSDQVADKEYDPEKYLEQRMTLYGGSVQGLKTLKQDLYVTGESVQEYYPQGFDASPQSSLINYSDYSLLRNTEFTDYADFDSNAIDSESVFNKFSTMIETSRRITGSTPDTIIIGYKFYNKLLGLKYGALGKGENIISDILALLGPNGRIETFANFDKMDLATGQFTESYILIYNEMLKPFVINDGYAPKPWQGNGGTEIFMQDTGSSGNESEHGFIKTIIGPILFKPNIAKSVIRAKMTF